jgi:hypothetical protein
MFDDQCKQLKLNDYLASWLATESRLKGVARRIAALPVPTG